MKYEPMTLEQLHAIAVARKGDSVTKALLLEIKRPHGVVRDAHDRIGALVRYSPDPEISRRFAELTDLFDGEPCIDQPMRTRSGPPARELKQEARKRRNCDLALHAAGATGVLRLRHSTGACVHVTRRFRAQSAITVIMFPYEAP